MSPEVCRGSGVNDMHQNTATKAKGPRCWRGPLVQGEEQGSAYCLNSARIDCELPLAIDSDWMPSCCWTWRACRRVDSLFMSASTSAPTPLSMESDRFDRKLFWVSMRDLAAPR